MPTAPDPAVRFAAERTLMAWIRTGLALMGFGFVVARFGLFMRELAPGDVSQSSGWSQGLGITLIALGVIVNLLSAGEHHRIIRRIDRGEPYRPPRWSLGLTVTMLLAALGLVMVGYLLQV